jgi:hypothetical protein
VMTGVVLVIVSSALVACGSASSLTASARIPRE